MLLPNVPEEAIFCDPHEKGTQFKLVDRNKADLESGATSDQIIEMGSGNRKVTLRKIGYFDPETYKYYVFLTNNFTLAGKVIADLYKSRWQVEIFSRKSSSS